MGFSPFARHYLGNFVTVNSQAPGPCGKELKVESYHISFLFHWLLRCFTSPGSLYAPMYSVHNIQLFNWMGSPIRRFPGHRLLSTSPRLIAACYVLHRLIMSRHPPFALIAYHRNTKLCFFLNTYNYIDSLTYSIVMTSQIQPHSYFEIFEATVRQNFSSKKPHQAARCSRFASRIL